MNIQLNVIYSSECVEKINNNDHNGIIYPYLYGEIGYYDIYDVQITPDNLLVHDDEIIFKKYLYNNHFIESKLKDHQSVKKINSAHSRSIRTNNEYIYILLSRQFCGVYGHWLLDMLPAIWLFLRYFKIEQHHRFLMHDDIPDFAKKMLSLLFGIEHSKCIEIPRNPTHTMQVKHLIVPSLMTYGTHFSTRLPLFVKDCIDIARHASKKTISSEKFLYLKRASGTKVSGRFFKNSNEIELIAIEFGFKVITPENLPWEDQIIMFSSASILIAEFGSLSHNSLFLRQNSTCLVISHSRINKIQEAISNVNSSKLEYIYADHEEIEMKSKRLEFTVDPENFRKKIQMVLRQANIPQVHFSACDRKV
jgi:hypothetical protein